MPGVTEAKKKRWTREEIAEKIVELERASQGTPSQRQLAEELGIPRTTLQHWLKRKDSIDADPEVVAFFESPVGVAFLHRLVLVAHFVMTLVGPCGIRLVCLFLELSGLDRFVRKRGPGRPPRFDKRIAQAQERERAAQQALETAAEQQERVKRAIQGISAVYHPYDLESGAPRSAEALSTALEQHFTEMEEVATETHLSERCLKKIRKAKRVVVEMVATIAFFFLTVRAKVEALSLPPAVEQAVYDNLIPAIYLHLVSEKTQDAEQRHALQRRATELLAPLLARDGPLCGLGREEKLLIENVAQECAQLFQRSSSCVEGRNGHLALRHHSLHRISDRKLAALTTVHNYFVKRSDSTTAAERFFSAKPRDLFDWVLERVDLPGRPAQKRSQSQRKKYLAQTAA